MQRRLQAARLAVILNILRSLWCVRRFLLAALLLVTATGVGAQAPQVPQLLIVLSDNSASYQAVAEELRSRVPLVREGRVRLDVLTAEALTSADASALSGAELVVTVGLAAAQAVFAQETALNISPPTLCLLIPRQSYERLVSAAGTGRGRRASAVFIDQPLSRQLDLIRLALPNRVRVGVIFGPNSEALKDELREKARERNLILHTAAVTEASGVYGALQKVLPDSNLLLALPDPVAVNASTAYGLLLASYRAQVPVVGFSEGMVRAGALLGLFSTASEQGKQGAEIVTRFLAGASDLPAPQYPNYFTVRANYSVARSLGLQMEDEAALAAGLVARSEGIGVGGAPRASDGAPPGKAP